ncbi:tripartite tricarboxylate transporter substrate binding protein [Peribacillus cavernae]|uniref:Tripartite tricarboxylate transporter substrate binding protein n=1 Tax=Peribacillus cavernae TaxID=1674310 RepID=A0A433H9W7_9BACI|nr:tripartite tricarboxylate transporter substrate binding protein [Peribacillus cavernae]MDQ0219729.1 tripartite-type tricarboxylate transporter receptor subunit TctC [Peribacillus cavernae]RUQ25150.1 tripartite tricarboxylate transporter substrate binding protein [Peribacillus cavernae]
MIIKKNKFQLLLAVSLAFGLITSGCSASNQTANSNKKEKIDYPTKQVEYVVPFAAGGGTDLVARAVAQFLSKEWGKPVTVVNKPGAGGIIGSQAVLQQGSNDGYTALANGPTSTTLLTAGMTNPPVKLKDHLFVSQFAEDSMAFTVKADARWKDFKEFCEWVKKNPEKLTWTSVGPSGLSVFTVAEWLHAIGVDYDKTRMVVTTGAADAMPKIAGGHAVLGVHSVNEVSSMVEAGKVKILATLSSKRSPYYPDVPTVEEQGVTGLTTQWWTGVSLPVGTPKEVVKKWEEATAKMVKDPTFIEKLKNLKLEASYKNTADFNNSVKEEGKSFSNLAKEYGLQK